MKKLNDFYKKLDIQSRAMIAFVIANIFQKGIAIIGTPIFTRILPQEQFGFTVVYQSWLNIFSVFITLNLSYGVFINAMNKYKGDEDQYTASMQGLSTCSGIFWIIIISIFSNVFTGFSGISKELWIFMILFLILNSAFEFWMARQKFEYKYISVLIIACVSSVFSISISVIAVLLDRTALNKIIFSNLCLMLIGLYFYMKTFSKGKVFYHREYWKFALTFNVPLVPHYLSMIILNHSDRIMIQNMCGYVEAGLYSVAHQIANLLILVSSAMTSSLTPFIYKHLDLKKYKDIDMKIFGNTILISICTILIIGIGPEIMKIFAGQEYYEAVYCIPPLVLAVLIQYFYSFYGTIEFYLEKTKFTMIISTLCTLVNIVLNYIFVPHFGYKACAYTTLVCFIIIAIGHILYSDYLCRKKMNDIVIEKKKYLLLFSIVFFLSFLLFVFYNNIVFRYITMLIFTGVCLSNKNKLIKLFKK